MKRKVVREEGRELEEEEPRVDFHIHSAFFCCSIELAERARKGEKGQSGRAEGALCYYH